MPIVSYCLKSASWEAAMGWVDSNWVYVVRMRNMKCTRNSGVILSIERSGRKQDNNIDVKHQDIFGG
jgi:hypothetical protein